MYVDNNGHLVVVVHLLVVAHGLHEVMVAALLVDGDAMADNPDVGTDVHEGDEQENELDDEHFPGLARVGCFAGVQHRAEGREENVQKQAPKAGSAMDRLDMTIAAAHI